ncbi:HD domain-containing protein [Patescibacteria group bacterium]|nr:HD domain-containing protein [Patescibacteria group bacterium]
MNNCYSSFLHNVIEFAAQSHKGQRRKYPFDTPYISHPFNVGIILLKAGYEDEVVAAGLLHDVIEDCGVTSKEIEEKFGKRVSTMVEQVSEPKSVSDWHERKRIYREVLDNADVGSLAVAAADHLHNLKSLLIGISEDEEMLNKFNVSMNDKLIHEEKCLVIFESKLQDELTKELAEVVKEFKDSI